MQRKFRMWDKDKQEMVYIDPTTRNQKIVGMFFDLINKDKLSVMQYIGLQDSRGTDVYEGDYLRFDEQEWGGPHTQLVQRMDEWKGRLPLSGTVSDVSEWTIVVGNIYQLQGITND